MKEVVKVSLLNFVGLMAAFVLYPFFHEIGHGLAAVAVGAEMITMEWLPIPSLLCRMDVTNRMSVICVGFGGILLPFCVTLCEPPKRFLLWYLWFVMKGICILSFGISLWAILFYQTELQIAEDDMTRVLQFVPDYKWEYCLVLIFLIPVALMQMISSKPLVRYRDYFVGNGLTECKESSMLKEEEHRRRWRHV